MNKDILKRIELLEQKLNNQEKLLDRIIIQRIGTDKKTISEKTIWLNGNSNE